MNALSLITKGILGIRGSLIGLITKGFITRGVGGLIRAGAQVYRKVFKWFFEIIGKKAFELRIIYDIIGRKKVQNSYALSLAGKKQLLTKIDYLIKALRKKEVESFLQLAGKKLFETNEQIILQGIRSNGFLEDLDLEGTKRLGFDLKKTISAQRKYFISKETQLMGIKEMKLNNTLEINGKRDRINILVALNLLGELDR